MTDQELKDLVASVIVSVAETARLQQENAAETVRLRKETDRHLRETARLQQENAAETVRLREETELQMRETDRAHQENAVETDRLQQETAAELGRFRKETELQMRETDRILREVGKQIGGLGDKFGSFTEGMAFPAMKKLLQERFHMSTIALRTLSRRNGRSLELDVLAYSNTDRNEVYVVEVKSHLREDGLRQFLKILNDFPEFFPVHRDKELYGILAAIDIPEDLRRRVLAQGIYLAQISGDAFELQLEGDFEPRSFQS